MRKATLTTCLLVSLVLGACGSSSPSGLSKAALVKRTTAICASLRSSLSKLHAPANTTSVPQLRRYYEKVLPPSEAAITQLRKLTPAKDVKATWLRYVTASGRSVAFFEGLLVKLKAGERPALTGYSAMSRELRAAVAALGVPAQCASA